MGGCWAVIISGTDYMQPLAVAAFSWAFITFYLQGMFSRFCSKDLASSKRSMLTWRARHVVHPEPCKSRFMQKKIREAYPVAIEAHVESGLKGLRFWLLEDLVPVVVLPLEHRQP